jgi:hypothetical protein
LCGVVDSAKQSKLGSGNVHQVAGDRPFRIVFTFFSVTAAADAFHYIGVGLPLARETSPTKHPKSGAPKAAGSNRELGKSGNGKTATLQKNSNLGLIKWSFPF